MIPTRIARAADKPCELYAHNGYPRPSRTQGHHRHPVYLQNRVYGQIRDPELMWLCGLCHDNVHEYLSWRLREAREPYPMPGGKVRIEALRTLAWYNAALTEKENAP